jgi:hypothetical protein
MDETPERNCLTTATPQGGANDPLAKDWDEFNACERCHGRAPIEETPDGELFCQECRCKLPRPST